MYSRELVKQRFDFVKSSKTFNRIVQSFHMDQKKTLDVGCGYGEYLTVCGEGSVGVTTTEDEIQYGKEVGLDIRKGNVEFIDELNIGTGFEMIWANNLFEHLLSPHAFLIRLKKISRDDTVLILGVPVIPKIVSLLRLGRFRGALASNHISFFTRKSLMLTVEYAGWQVAEARPFISNNSFVDRLFAIIAPHMYIVARNNSKFKYPEKKRKEWEGESHYRHLFDITDRS
jgi:SAM-dependent methyltransferase